MHFLAPLFLAGAAAIGLPILFHLIRNTPGERRIFSSLMFLRPTQPRLTRRSRLEHLWLLLLRCLVICLLALAFARPFFAQTISEALRQSPGKKIVVLIDTSASMRRADLWSDAKASVMKHVEKLSPDDQFALVAFDREFHSLINFQEWSALNASQRSAAIQQRLASISPSWAGTHLAGALMNAAELLKDNPDEQKREQILLVTDLQQGSRLEGLEGFAWPKGIELILEIPGARDAGNAGLQIVGDHSQGRANRRLRIINSANSQTTHFPLTLRQDDLKHIGNIEVAPGQNQIVALPPEFEKIPAGEWSIAEDKNDFDNRIFIAPPFTETTKILFQGDDTASDSERALYYLLRVFQNEPQRQSVQIISHDARTPFSTDERSRARLLITTTANPESWRNLLSAEGTILFVPRTAADAETLTQIPGLEKVRVAEAPSDNFALLGQIDFQAPLFAPFADPRFSDFTKIHFWKHRQFALNEIPNAKVLARFDNGDPAFVSFNLNHGTVLLLASSWTPEDSQLALSSKFVPLLYSVLEQSGGVASRRQQFAIGDEVDLSNLGTADALIVVKPDGAKVEMAKGETRFRQTDLPGVYRVSQNAFTFAVNLPADESRTDPINRSELEALGFPLGVHDVSKPTPTLAQRQQLANAELENRQKLWRYLILGALLVLIVESWLAGRLTQPKNQIKGAV
jgi:hypothetical protein